MKTLKQTTLALTITLMSLVANAQQAPMYTHYMNNTLVVNPGYAGSRDALTITALHRSQWVDFEGAPTTQTITMHAPVKNQHIGVGFSIMNDNIGPVNNTTAMGHFSYIMDLTPKSKLALGLNAGMNMFQANLSSLELDQQADPVFQNDVNSQITPNFGFGAYYYRERFYTGVSVPNLIQNNFSTIPQENGNTLIASEQRHYFFIAGALIRLSDAIDFKPTTFVKVTPAAPIQADLTASFVFMDRLLLGTMFRTGDALGALVGVNVTDLLHISYSYDWSYELQTNVYNKGSHELMLRYDILVFDKNQIHSPRHF